MVRNFRLFLATLLALATIGAFAVVNSAYWIADAAPTTVTLNAAADTYVSTSAPNSNYGSSTSLSVSESSYRVLLRFNVSLPVGSNITSVSLRLYSNTSVNGRLIVHPSSNDWVETTVTAASQPPWQTAELGRTGVLRSKQYASAALPTNAIASSGSVSFGVNTTAGVKGNLGSRESTQRPQLVIIYEPAGTPTPTPSPTSTATPTPSPTSTAPANAPKNIRLDPAYTTDLQHTARFLWDAVPNATMYRHYLNGVAIAGQDDTSTSETVGNLQPGTAYTFAVGAFVGGVEYKSAPFSFTTAAASPTPTPTPTSTQTATPTPSPTSTAPANAPKNIRLDPAYTTDLQHTARFLWDAVPNATMYRHYLNGVAIAGQDDTSTSETVGNLQPGTAYTFAVGAFVGGVEYKSAPFSFTTAAASPTPTPTPTSTQTATPTPSPTSTAPANAPKNIRLDPAYTTDLQHTARFLWDAVPNATMYRHYLNGVAIAGQDDTSTSETVGNLQPGTAYTFAVGAFVGGVEYKSAPFSFTTAAASPTPTPTSTAPANAPKNIRLDPDYALDLQHTARFLWDAVPNATMYRHYLNGVAIAGEDDTSTSETVGNLQPATGYTFAVGAFVGGVEYKSAPFSFTTAGTGATPTPTPTPTEGGWDIAAVGDMNNNNNASMATHSGANATAIVNGLNAGTIDHFLGLGDFQYDWGTCANLVNYWHKVWGGVLPKTYWAAGPGHDVDLTVGFNDIGKYMNGQCVGNTARSGTNTHLNRYVDALEWYSFDQGNWHVLHAPTAAWRYNATRAQAMTAEIDAVLAAAKAQGKHLAVMYHDPYFTSATSSHTRETKVKPWIDVFWKHRVRVLLSGSQHNYERSCPVNNADQCVGDGMQQFQVSTGGKEPLRPFLDSPSYIQRRFADTHGHLLMSLFPDGSYTWNFKPVGGVLQTDSGYRAPG